MKRIVLVICLLTGCCFLVAGISLAEDDSPPAMGTYNKAVALYQAHNWDAAKDCFHEYLAEYSDTPLYVTCLYYLAYCYQQLGNKKINKVE